MYLAYPPGQDSSQHQGHQVDRKEALTFPGCWHLQKFPKYQLTRLTSGKFIKYSIGRFATDNFNIAYGIEKCANILKITIGELLFLKGIVSSNYDRIHMATKVVSVSQQL
jgi:hypothetical protein